VHMDVMSLTCASYWRSIRGIWDIRNGKQPNRKPYSEPRKTKSSHDGRTNISKTWKITRIQMDRDPFVGTLRDFCHEL